MSRVNGAVVAGIATALAAVAGQGILAVTLLVCAVAIVLAGGVRGWAARIPEAFVWVLTASLGILLLAGFLHVPFTSTPVALRVVVAAVGLATAWWGHRHAVGGAQREDGSEPDLPVAPLWSWAPTAWAGCLAIGGALLPLRRSLIWFILGTDNIVHARLAVRILDAGGIRYDVAYPIAWHGLVAIALGISNDPTINAGLVLSALDTSSTSTWLLYAVLVASVSRLGYVIAANAGVRQRWLLGAVAAGSGTATLAPPFFDFTLLNAGFQTLVALAVALAAGAIVVIERRPGPYAVSFASAVVALIANTWQLALPVAAVLWLWVVIPMIRRPGAWKWVAGATLVGGALSAPPILTAFSTIGISWATLDGYADPLKWQLLLIGACAGVALILVSELSGRGARMRRVGRGRWVVVIACVFVVVAESVALAAYLKIPVLAYYPRKMLWVACLLLVPVIAAAGAAVLDMVTFGRRATWLVAITLVPVTAWLALLVVMTARAPIGRTTANDAGALLRVVIADGAANATTAYKVSFHPDRDLRARIFLDLFHPRDFPRETARTTLPLEEECRILQASPTPGIITAEPDEARRYFACVPQAKIIDVSAIPIESLP